MCVTKAPWTAGPRERECQVGRNKNAREEAREKLLDKTVMDGMRLMPSSTSRKAVLYTCALCVGFV